MKINKLEKKKLSWIIGIIIVVVIVVVAATIRGNNKSQFAGPVSAGEPQPEALVTDLEKYAKRLEKEAPFSCSDL